jgi:membrane fusion protein (multidrug efflux system)
MKIKSKIILAVSGVLLITLAAILIFKAEKQKDTNTRGQAILVKTEKPQRLTVLYQLQYNGDVKAMRQANIFSKVSGNLEKIYADLGDYVQGNQLLAIIDSTELYQQVLEQAATYQNARLNFQRTRQLLDQDMLPKEEADNAHTSMKIAEANFTLAKTRLRYACITAPFSGFITKRFLDPGALVAADNSLLFTLMDLNRVKIDINILEKDTPLIPRLNQAIIVADALPDQKFEGKITRHSQAIDLATRTMLVEVEVPNPDHRLKPGMFVTTDLIYDKHLQAVTVPSSAVLKDEQGRYLFIEENDRAKRQSIDIGVEQDSRTEILNGLNGTENIITTGQQFVRDGGMVQVQQ